MNSIKVETLEQYHSYQSKGYTSNIKDICIMLGIKKSKAKKLLSSVPKIQLSNKLFSKLQKIQSEQPYVSVYSRLYIDYYNDKEVFETLLNQSLLTIMYTDGNEGYEEISNDFIISNINEFIGLLDMSESVKDMELRDKYDYRWDRLQNETLYYVSGGIYKAGDIYSNSSRNIYIRKIRKELHLKFSVDGQDLYCNNKDIIKDLLGKG